MFLAGLGLGWALPHGHRLEVKAVRREGGLTVYTYYLDRHGHEVKHGWWYDLSENYDKRVLYANGKVVGFRLAHQDEPAVQAPPPSPGEPLP